MEDIFSGPAPLTECPSCGALLQFFMRLHKVVEVTRADEQASVSVPQQRPSEEEAFLSVARAGRLLIPFEQAVKADRGEHQLPEDMEGYFLTIMSQLVPRKLPASALGLVRRIVKDTGTLEAWQGHGIIVITVARRIRLFVPKAFLLGQRIKTLSGQKKGDGAPLLLHTDGLAEEWIRTRFGYVAGPGALLDALRQPSFGSFALPGL